MKQVLFIAIVACTFAALSSAAWPRTKYQKIFPRGVNLESTSSNSASSYFYYYLNKHFPNERFPVSKLIGTQYQGVGYNGDPSTPIEFYVLCTLQDSTGATTVCTATVHLGNTVSGDMYTLYFGDECV